MARETIYTVSSIRQGMGLERMEFEDKGDAIRYAQSLSRTTWGTGRGIDIVSKSSSDGWVSYRTARIAWEGM